MHDAYMYDVPMYDESMTRENIRFNFRIMQKKLGNKTTRPFQLKLKFYPLSLFGTQKGVIKAKLFEEFV